MSLLQNSNAISSGGYNLTDSVRFRSSASSYLSRTPTTASNRKTWTMSMWVKRGNNAYQQLAYASESPTYADPVCLIGFSSDTIDLFQYTSSFDFRLTTTQVFRDPSAWYHIVWSVDTTQATSTNRVKLYVNGEQVTSFTTATYPSLNFNTAFNYTGPHLIAARGAGGSVQEYFDGYMTEVNFVDGQALTPSDFGETDTDTGVWKPKKYTGTYGTNGFYLPMNQTVETYSADYLVVGGGGGGGTDIGGGGGAGGLLTGTTNLAIGSTYTVTVGAGGSGAATSSVRGSNGGNSSVSGTAFTTITSIGGGGGGSKNLRDGALGGSGGGNANALGGTGGAGTSGQGFAGGVSVATQAGGGGGGAGAIGSNSSASNTGGAGGIGATSNITGSSTYYAGGGGGGGYSGTASNGGTGGGGKGEGYGNNGSGTAGTNGLGGGGGAGGGGAVGYGKAGGSGVVILRVPTAKYTGTVTGSPTVTTDGSDTVIKFTASGTYTA